VRRLPKLSHGSGRRKQPLITALQVRWTLEIIAANLSKAGWTWGCVSAVDSAGRTIRIADAML